MPRHLDISDLVALVGDAGVVGAGGGGFPAAKKLSGEFEHYIANGAECEPLLRKDVELMRRCGDEVVEALALVRDARGAKKAYFAAKRKYSEVWETVLPHLDTYGVVPVELDDFFPAGDEFELVERVLGRVVPPGGIPLAVGAAVNNVETLLNIRRALEGKPVTHKWLTVAGAVERPFTAVVPLGVPAKALLDYAKPTKDDFVVIEGGPMMGALVSLDEPVKKTTSGFIVLDADHRLVKSRTMPLRYVLRLAASACMQCQTCSDLCPRHLLGHPIEPHRIMRSAAHPISLPLEAMLGALICSECGVCELFACPMGLSPRRVNAALKKRFAESGVRYSWSGDELSPRRERDFRRIPYARLLERLGVDEFEHRAYDFLPSFEYDGELVLKLKQHAGVAAKPVVSAGELVGFGQVLAALPEGKLGAPIHSPASGKVVRITEDSIVVAPR